MKVRIKSDGATARVEDVETGAAIEGVFDVQVSMPVAGVFAAIIKCYPVKFDIVSEAERIVCCPNCKMELAK